MHKRVLFHGILEILFGYLSTSLACLRTTLRNPRVISSRLTLSCGGPPR